MATSNQEQFDTLRSPHRKESQLLYADTVAH